MKVLTGLIALLIGALFVWLFLQFRMTVGCADTVCNPAPIFPFLTSGHVFYGLVLISALLIAVLVGDSIFWPATLALTVTGGIFYDLWYHKYAH